MSQPPVLATLSGKLYGSQSGWLLLQVPNAIGRGAFAALNAPGAELSVWDNNAYNAHISVMSDTDVQTIGGLEKINERGKAFEYTLGPVKSVRPAGGPYSQVWYITVHSSDLEKLRKSYGLTAKPHGGRYEFHITFAGRRKKVLWNNAISKWLPAANSESVTVQIKAACVCPGCSEQITDGRCCSSCSSFGIINRPEEFAELVLHNSFRRAAADTLQKLR